MKVPHLRPNCLIILSVLVTAVAHTTGSPAVLQYEARPPPPRILYPPNAPRAKAPDTPKDTKCREKAYILYTECTGFAQFPATPRNWITESACCPNAKQLNQDGCFCAGWLITNAMSLGTNGTNIQKALTERCGLDVSIINILNTVGTCPNAPPAPSPPTKTGKGSSGVLLGVVAGGAFAVVVAAIAMVLLFLRRRRHHPRWGNDLERGEEEDGLGSLASNVGVGDYSYGELAEATNGFNSSLRLGQGAFGTVFKGTLKDGTVVAIKKMAEETHQGEKAFRSEANIIGRLRHPNLVLFHGFCAEKNHRLLVYEYMPNGSLDRHLFVSHNTTKVVSSQEKKSRSSWRRLRGSGSAAGTPVTPQGGSWGPGDSGEQGTGASANVSIGKSDDESIGGTGRRVEEAASSRSNSDVGRGPVTPVTMGEGGGEGEVEAPVLSWEARRGIAVDVAVGLQYLHEEADRKGQILHRDVKSSNILLDENMRAKLGDFGLARVLRNDLMMTHLTTGPAGTVGYLPPEGMVHLWQPNARWDVFSYGVVLLEIVSGRPAVDSTRDGMIQESLVQRAHDISFEGGNLLSLVDPHLGGTFPAADAAGLIRLGLWCTSAEPVERPTMGIVVKMLSGDLPLPTVAPKPLPIRGPYGSTPSVQTPVSEVPEQVMAGASSQASTTTRNEDQGAPNPLSKRSKAERGSFLAFLPKGYLLSFSTSTFSFAMVGRSESLKQSAGGRPRGLIEDTSDGTLSTSNTFSNFSTAHHHGGSEEPIQGRFWGN